jgi:hypothetical protein
MTKQYEDVLVALERKAPLAEIRDLLRSLERSSTDINAGINEVDEFGLTICMRAAAHGRVRVVKAAYEEHGASIIEKRNPLTKASILHYAAQQPLGGAEIIRWAIGKTSKPLLTEQILVKGTERDREEDKYWDRGNGHTVAFEAVFNNNVPVVKTLLSLKKEGRAMDFDTPAVHGLSPLGWALTTKNSAVVSLLKSDPKLLKFDPEMTDDQEQKEAGRLAAEYAQAKDNEWRDHLTGQRKSEDIAGLELADKLREYIVDGSLRARSVDDLLEKASDGDLNKHYGRFGQPLLILIPTHPKIMNISEPRQDQKYRYAEVVGALIDKGADPMTKEKGLMEVSAGFREVFFGYTDALERMIENVKGPKRDEFVNEVGMFNGYTRLIDSGLIRKEEAIQLLLDYGADRNIRGFNGWTAVDAARGGNSATAALTD